jgi:hypothetical protein
MNQSSPLDLISFAFILMKKFVTILYVIRMCRLCKSSRTGFTMSLNRLCQVKQKLLTFVINLHDDTGKLNKMFSQQKSIEMRHPFAAGSKVCRIGFIAFDFYQEDNLTIFNCLLIKRMCFVSDNV